MKFPAFLMSLFLFASLSSSCAQFQVLGKRITFGKDVEATDELNQYILMLSMNRPGGTNICSGVAVDTNVILTAAHCIQGLQSSQISVIKTQDTGLKISLKVAKLMIHPKFDGTAGNHYDLALIAVDGYPFQKYLSITQAFPGGEILLAGYGSTGTGKKDSMTLRKVTISSTQLHRASKYLGIRQGNNHGGFCQGDSGAPIIVESKSKRFVVGINSFTVSPEDVDKCSLASVASSVAYNFKWISTEKRRLSINHYLDSATNSLLDTFN